MAKYNKSTTIVKTVRKHPDRTKNLAGGEAFTVNDAREQLYLMIATSLMGEDKYYASGSAQDKQIVNLISQVATEDPQFILQLAAYTRKELNLRSAPVFLLAHAANKVESKPFVKDYTPKIIMRADELTEVLQLYKQKFLKKAGRAHTFPASLKKGVAASFGKFDEYQFGKYNRDGEMKLKDALRIVIGQLKETNTERRELYKKILEGTLATPETWEVKMSTEGSSSENWQAMLDSGKMGIFAVTRNLRNMLDKNVKMDKAIETLTNPKQVENSRMFPFRFFQAYKEIDGKAPTKVTDALITAIEMSADKNMPRLKGTTFIATDLSGSMSSMLNDKSSIAYVEIGALMGATAHRYCEDSIVAGFGDTFKVIPISKKDSIITNMHKIWKTQVGHSTNGYLTIQYLLDNKIKVDRIFLFSDCQMYDSNGYSYTYGSGTGSIATLLKKYKMQVNPNVYTYVFDLAGYGAGANFPKDEPRVGIIGGWNDKVFNFIERYESDPAATIKYIKENY